MKSRGFTLIELLVVLAIIAIVSLVGLTYYGGVIGSGEDAKRKTEIDQIAKAYEVSYHPTAGYRALSAADFTSEGMPTPSEGSYTYVTGPNSSTPAGNTFLVCAALKGGTPGCSVTSATCYCKAASQGSSIAQGAAPPASYGTPTSYGTPSYGTPASPPPPPPPSGMRVFVTSTFYGGNLGGVAGADAKCQDRANAASLGSTWKAWISPASDSNSATLRLAHSSDPYKLLNGVTVANNWADLTDGAIATNINVNEFGSTIPSSPEYVWTNTRVDGTAAINVPTTNTCGSDWNINTSNQGWYGFHTLPVGWGPAGWTFQSVLSCGNTQVRLYCFEQPPAPAFKRVFVTSTTYSANLGGLAGADAKCQTQATAASLGGTWKAWLSDTTGSAASRLTHSTIPYKLLNGTTVANDWNDLTDGTLQAPINITELYVWTHTSYQGFLYTSTNTCSNWTSSVGGGNNWAVTGSSTTINSDWSQGTSHFCSNLLSLYCFEQ